MHPSTPPLSTPTGDSALLQAIERLDIHQHLCLIYEAPQEQFAAVVPFMRIGIERGQQCVYIADENTIETVRQALEEGGIDTASAIHSGGLRLVTKRETYLKEGRFDPDKMIAFLDQCLQSAQTDGFSALRITGEMTWALGREPGNDRLIEYEAKLNQFFPSHDALAICQYNRQRFPAAIIRDVIRTHPMVIFGNTVCQNYYYVPPEEMLTPDSTDEEVDRLLHMIRQREVTEKKLTDQQARLTSLIDAITESAFLMDTQGTILSLNKTLAERLGSTIEEMLGRNIYDFLPPDIAQRRRGYVEQVITSGQSIRVEDEHLGRIIDHCIYPVTGNDGRVNALAVFGMDITDHKHAEEALCSAEEQYRAIANYTFDWENWIDPNGRLKWVSPSVACMTGYTVQECLSMPDYPMPLIHPEDREAVTQWMQQAADESMHNCEIRIVCKDGTVKWASVYSQPIYDDQGAQLGHRSSIRDITERKNAELALQKSEARYRALAQNFPHGALFLFDQDYCYLIADGESFKVAGLNPEEVVGRKIEEVFPELWETIKPHCDAALEGQRVHYEIEYKGRIYSNYTLPLESPSASGRQAIDVTLDITERKQMESHNRLLADIVKRSQDFIGVADMNQKAIYVNPAGQAMVGLDGDEAVRQTQISDYFFPEDLPFVEQHIIPALQNEGRWAGEFRFRNFKTGQPVYVLYDLFRTEDPETGQATQYTTITRDISDHKAAEEALKQSEKRLGEQFNLQKSLLDNIPDPAWLKDAQGRFLDVNEAWCRFVGKTREEAVGHTAAEFMPPNRAGIICEHDEAAIQSGQMIMVEEVLEDTEGQPHWFETIKSPIFDEQGTIIGTTGIAHDITERQQAEAASRQAAGQWQTTFDAVGDAIWLLDNDSRIIRCNRAAEELYDTNIEKIYGRPCWEIVHGTHTAPENCPHQRLPESQKREMTETAIGNCWYRVVVDPVFDEAGRLTGAVHIMSDITSRKMAEETLRRSEEKHRTILETAMDGFWLVDINGRLLEVNASYCKMSGYSEEELLSMTMADIEANESIEKIAERKERIKSVGEERFETRHRRKDGSIFDVEICVQYRPIEEGRFVAFLRDITERKQREQEKELLEAELRQSQKLEAVGQLAGGMAHDFNNLLTVIAGHAEMVKEEIQPDHLAQESLDMILDAAEQATGVTKSLLTFSRKVEGHVEQIVPRTVVHEVAHLLNRLLPRSIELTLEAPEEPRCYILADHVQLKQAILNLAINARDAMPNGGRLQIACRTETENVTKGQAGLINYVGIEVSDTGTGIAPQMMEKIFDPFFTTKSRGQGTGLGLSIVHGIVKNLGGRIEVQSDPGQGSSFKLLLPCILGEPESKAALTNEKTAKGKGETILLADDNDNIVTLLSRILSSHGYRVVTAQDGEAMLESWKQYQDKIGAIIADNDMPKRTGIDALVLIRQSGCRIPAILITGDVESSGHLESDPQTKILYKPFPVNDLAKHVRDLLDKQA